MKALLKALDISKKLFADVQNSPLDGDQDKMKVLELRLERSTHILLKAQEQLTAQAYYIGVQSDATSSGTGDFSLPLVRLLGIVKLRLAQANVMIGVLKEQMKGGSSFGLSTINMRAGSQTEKVVTSWLDTISKQIESQ
jgi:hypothetical protein